MNQAVTIPDRAPDGAVFPAAWRRCVGTGHLGLALRSDYQDSLALVQREIGFDFIRGHGLLSEALGIYRARHWGHEDAAGPAPALNFTYVDLICDSYLELGIRPFIELGFMPADLASGPETTFFWRGNVTPPRDHAEWRRLVAGLARHLVDRYGLDEVRTWPFEVWNEPDIGHFWTGDRADYFKLYRESARALKEVAPELRVGGPATCPASIDWIAPFLEMCAREDVPVDFASTHSYAADAVIRRGEYVYQTLNPRQDSLDQFALARRQVRESFRPDLPVHITEYNTSYSPRSPIHDTAYNAAYLAWLLARGGDEVDSFSYWTFSDMFEENDVPQAPFHGGFGLVTLRGIRKPTFHLFAFFRRLGTELLHRDDDCLVTRRSDGAVVLAAWNPVADAAADGRRTLRLDLPTPAPAVTLTRRRVDDERGNAWECWRRLGRPRFPSVVQTDLLHEASAPVLEVERHQAGNGRLVLDLPLGRNEVTVVEVEALADQTGTYAGLDDGLIPGYGL